MLHHTGKYADYHQIAACLCEGVALDGYFDTILFFCRAENDFVV